MAASQKCRLASFNSPSPVADNSTSAFVSLAFSTFYQICGLR
jgi:hypothetical protein